MLSIRSGLTSPQNLGENSVEDELNLALRETTTKAPTMINKLWQNTAE